MKTRIDIVIGMAVLAACGQASAATSWQLTSATASSGAFVVSSGGTTVTATGWANTGATPASTSGSDSTPLQQQTATGNLYKYSGGLGINNLDGCSTASGTCDLGDVQSDVPEHAIDNNQRYEMVLLSFSQSAKLTNTVFGWTGTSDYASGGGDSDFTVLAYTGTGAPTLAGLTWSTLGSGWAKIGNYANATTGTSNAINAANVYSSYWLIGAYNPLAGGTTSGLGAGNDYLKLASVTGDLCFGGTGSSCSTSVNSVPEPGSLTLFGVALLGVFGLRTRRKAS